MVTHVWFYSLLPLLTALFALFLVIKVYQSKGALSYLLLFANLVLTNFLQALGYVLLAQSSPLAEYIADTYLISSYYLLAHLMLLSLSIAQQPAMLWVSRFVYLFPLALSLLHMGGYLVSGYRFEQNALLHSDGVLAWCADSFAVFACVFTIVTLVKNVFCINNDRLLLSRNLIALISFVPLLITVIVLVLLSRTNHPVPVVVVIPCVSLYLLLVFNYARKSHLVDLSIGFSAFRQRIVLAWRVLQIFRDKNDYKQFEKDLEKQLINEALKRNHYDIGRTAKELCWHHTTLRNKIDQYHLLSKAL